MTILDARGLSRARGRWRFCAFKEDRQQKKRGRNARTLRIARAKVQRWQCGRKVRNAQSVSPGGGLISESTPKYGGGDGVC